MFLNCCSCLIKELMRSACDNHILCKELLPALAAAEDRTGLVSELGEKYKILYLDMKGRKAKMVEELEEVREKVKMEKLEQGR